MKQTPTLPRYRSRVRTSYPAPDAQASSKARPSDGLLCFWRLAAQEGRSIGQEVRVGFGRGAGLLPGTFDLSIMLCRQSTWLESLQQTLRRFDESLGGNSDTVSRGL